MEPLGAREPVLWRVDQYAGQESVRITATQLDPSQAGSAHEARAILANWIRFLSTTPTNIRELHFVSRVPQELLDAMAGQTELRSISVQGGPYRDIAALSELTRLQRVELSGATALESVEALRTLTDLTDLIVSQVHRMKSISALGQITGLRALVFGNESPGSDRSVVVQDLSWLTPLSRLTSLRLPGTRILSGDLSPILELTGLTELFVPLRRSYRKQVFEFAEQSAAFARVARDYEILDQLKATRRADGIS